MKKIALPTVFMLLFCLFASNSKAQEPSIAVETKSSVMRALHNYYTSDYLYYLTVYDSKRYQLLMSYFTESFEVQSNSGKIDWQEFFGTDLFDVAKFDRLRLDSVRYTLNYRNKYTVTLLSNTEVYALFGNDIKEKLNQNTAGIHPEWKIEWLSYTEFLNYRRLIGVWTNRNPQTYSQLVSSSDYKQIRWSDWNKLSTEERQQILSNPFGYEIIE